MWYVQPTNQKMVDECEVPYTHMWSGRREQNTDEMDEMDKVFEFAFTVYTHMWHDPVLLWTKAFNGHDEIDQADVITVQFLVKQATVTEAWLVDGCVDNPVNKIELDVHDGRSMHGDWFQFTSVSATDALFRTGKHTWCRPALVVRVVPVNAPSDTSQPISVLTRVYYCNVSTPQTVVCNENWIYDTDFARSNYGRTKWYGPRNYADTMLACLEVRLPEGYGIRSGAIIVGDTRVETTTSSLTNGEWQPLVPVTDVPIGVENSSFRFSGKVFQLGCEDWVEDTGGDSDEDEDPDFGDYFVEDLEHHLAPAFDLWGRKFVNVQYRFKLCRA